MNKIMNRAYNPDLGKLLIRIALGVVFISAGWMKLQGADYVVTAFAEIGIPAFLTYFVIYAEMIGGALLILGVAVRSVSVVLAIIMLVAIVKVHWAAGFSMTNGGYEYPLVLGLCAVALVTMGGGRYAVGRLLKRKSAVAAPQQ